MGLIFKANEIVERSKGLTFDDVLLLPQHCEMTSRLAPNLATRITKNHPLQIPIVSANMDTVTESNMANRLAQFGGIGILHRFMSVQDQVEELKKITSLTAASVGVKEEGMRRADFLADAGVNILTIDIAHGDSVMMLEVLAYIKTKYPHIDVIAGNVAMPSAVRRLIDNGADAIKVGIGPGSMCTTRIVTGCGVPQLTAIALCASEASPHGIPIIADGGIKNSGDVMKALAAGASTVMLGSIFAGCLETPGDIVEQGDLHFVKRYRGMASKDAQDNWKGGLVSGTTAEGVAKWIDYKGSIADIITELCGGIRSGMTYVNAKTIKEIHLNSSFIEITNSGMKESKPHGVL